MRRAFIEVSVVPGATSPSQGQADSTHASAAADVTAVHVSPAAQACPEPAPSFAKQGQSGFRRMCRMEEACPNPIPGLPAGVLEMRVKEGSKIHNLMSFAMARVLGDGQEEGGAASGLRQLVFVGSGRAVTKTITCAEIMKRRVGGLHQLTKVCYRSVRELWESSQDNAPEVTVHRTVPSISILLSKDPLDPREPGYQPPQPPGAPWDSAPQDEGRDGDLPYVARKRAPDLLTVQPGSKKPRV